MKQELSTDKSTEKKDVIVNSLRRFFGALLIIGTVGMGAILCTPMSAAAVSHPASAPSAGRALFLSQGCSACHGTTAHGTRFAPSLIGIGEKFPGGKLPYLLRHPTSAMRNGGMPTVTLNDAQLHQLVAYLSSLTPESTSAPAVPTPVQPKAPTQPAPLSPLAQRGQRVFQTMHCSTCHGVGGLTGSVAAPPLAGTASLLSPKVIETLLRHHSEPMLRGGMPLTNLSPQNMKALIAYIRSMPSSSLSSQVSR